MYKKSFNDTQNASVDNRIIGDPETQSKFSFVTPRVLSFKLYSVH